MATRRVFLSAATAAGTLITLRADGLARAAAAARAALGSAPEEVARDEDY